ncbi:MAG TPA: hybrid sensor histidine kinase/response regulator [Kofleriaceae bacterium]|nr:hybrid sensor histidine kinase/response regulator [Kofleriaceae bacterium]
MDSFQGAFPRVVDADHRQGDPESPIARVLVVDDHPGNRLAVEAVLEPLGHELVMAASGEEALGHLLQQDFAVVLLDVHMDGLDGLETASLIKQTKRTRHTPIIFLTGVSGDAEHIFRGYEQGAVDYMVKPFDPAALRAKVRVFIDLYLQSERIKQQARMLTENARLYEQERRARAEAEAAMRAREHVLAVVSHDLRGPLASIVIGASMMAEASPTTPELALYRRHAAAIQRAAEQMSQLLNDLLDVSRLEAGALSLAREACQSAELIRTTVDTFQPQAEKRHLQLHVDDQDGNTHVFCDRGRVLQVFSNLVGNALKFTPEGGHITVRSCRAGDAMQFSVADTGPGIPAEQLPHIFERYWQARTADRQGVGLGLAIAKGIVDAHGGVISVESSESGTTFTFSIPIAKGGLATV